MPEQLAAYRVFIASPGGLQEERREFRSILDEFNGREGRPRSIRFEPVGWKDTLSSAGRPQQIINEELKRCDYFILLLWDRWGSPPDVPGRSAFTSGTEEEFNLATKCLADVACPMKEIAILFKGVDERRLSDPGKDLQKVLDFRKKFDDTKEFLYNTFDDLDKFSKLIRSYLSTWLWNLEPTQHGSQPMPRAAFEPKHAEEAPPQADSASSVSRKARTLADEGRLTEAEVLLAGAVEGGMDPDSLSAYADLLARMGRDAQATRVYRRLLNLSEKHGQRWRAIALGGLGNLALSTNPGQSAQYFSEAATIAESLGDQDLRANQMHKLGRAQWLLGDLKRAEKTLRHADRIYESRGFNEGVANVCNMLGLIQRDSGAREAAEENFRRALQIYTDLGKPAGTANALNNIGLLFQDRGALEQAEANFRESLNLNLRNGHLDGAALNHSNLGEVYRKKGAHEMASDEFRLATHLYDGLGLLEQAEHARSLMRKSEECVESNVRTG
jgi:tetratricopeptide (TPR) repeat protein